MCLIRPTHASSIQFYVMLSKGYVVLMVTEGIYLFQYMFLFIQEILKYGSKWNNVIFCKKKNSNISNDMGILSP